MPAANPVTKAVTTAAKKLGLKWERTYSHKFASGMVRIKLFSCTKFPNTMRAPLLRELEEKMWRTDARLSVLKIKECAGMNGEFSYNIYVI